VSEPLASVTVSPVATMRPPVCPAPLPAAWVVPARRASPPRASIHTSPLRLAMLSARTVPP
jgi:hypothetical protein